MTEPLPPFEVLHLARDGAGRRPPDEGDPTVTPFFALTFSVSVHRRRDVEQPVGGVVERELGRLAARQRALAPHVRVGRRVGEAAGGAPLGARGRELA